jgi:tetratricopeptide (TPR) repeat protein
MRVQILILSFVIVTTLVLVHPWAWDRFNEPLWLKLEFYQLDAKMTNAYRMTDDLIELLADHPTIERLYARAYVARALDSCDYAGLAFPEEIDDFGTAIRLDPKYARAYVYRGCGINHVYHATHGHIYSENQLISDLNMAIKLDPRGTMTQAAYSVLALEYACELQQYQKALEICDMAIANSSPSDARRHYHCRAWIYGKMGEQLKESHDYKVAQSLDSNLQWADRVNMLDYQLRWIEWLALTSMPLGLWICRRLNSTPALVA